ncbi:methyltransferase type 12 [Crenothrix sp. D3]|nr:methyltransferase type 12 [Crenothrix sp. D3]
MTALIDKWNAIYSQTDPDNSVVSVLSDYAFLLPITGTALDLACGLGNNAIFLAQHGLAVTALDISSVAINKLAHYASEYKLTINAYQQQITPSSLKADSFDVIIVSRFLDRTLMNAIIGALRTNGLLFYQTFTREKATHTPPHNPDYLLAKNELLALFDSLTVVFYQENALIGQHQQGLRNEAQFIGQKIGE